MMRDGNETDYYLGNVSCTGSNRIEFQSGDVIGYHQGSDVHYQLWSIESDGYTSYYYHNASSPLNNLNNNSDVQSAINRQPLIAVMYGKINMLMYVKEFSMLYF